MLNFKYALHGNAVYSLHGRIACCTVPESLHIVHSATHNVGVNCQVIKTKKESKHPQLTVAFYLHRLKWIHGYLHVAKKDLRLSKRYEGEMECKMDE